MAKGGAYENTIIRKLTNAFACLGIQEDDCFRTKNSGASASQPGDIQLSPKFAKVFPALVECKHYKRIKYQLGKSLDHQDASFHLFKWWKQVEKEQRQAKAAKGLKRKGILVFRQNRCPDLVAVTVEHFEFFCGILPKWQMFAWSMFATWKDKTVVVVHLDEFLSLVIDKLKKDRIIRKQLKSSFRGK